MLNISHLVCVLTKRQPKNPLRINEDYCELYRAADDTYATTNHIISSSNEGDSHISNKNRSLKNSIYCLIQIISNVSGVISYNIEVSWYLKFLCLFKRIKRNYVLLQEFQCLLIWCSTHDDHILTFGSSDRYLSLHITYL